MKKLLVCFLCVMLVVFFVTTGAQAQLIEETFYLTSDHMTDGAGIPPFGEVTLTENIGDVTFLVSLYDGSQFVRTGAGDGMNFLFNAADIVLGDIFGGGLTAAEGPFSHGGGTFQYGVYFTGQGTGGSDAMSGPIGFTVYNSTIDDFILDNGIGEIFVADILSGQTGFTGLVDASGSSVPEPATMLLLGSGILGLALFGRQRFK